MLSRTLSEQASRRRRLALRAYAAIFLVTLVGGYLVGSAASPRFSNSLVLREHVIANASLFCANRTTVPDSQVRSIPMPTRRPTLRETFFVTPVRGTYVCDATAYDFDLLTGALTTRPSNAHAQWASSRRGLSLDATLVLLAGGGTSAYTLPKALESGREFLARATKGEAAAFVVKAAVLVASGFAVGFWLSYEPMPDCSDFAKAQQTTPSFWAGVARAVHDRHPAYYTVFPLGTKHPESAVALRSPDDKIFIALETLSPVYFHGPFCR